MLSELLKSFRQLKFKTYPAFGNLPLLKRTKLNLEIYFSSCKLFSY